MTSISNFPKRILCLFWHGNREFFFQLRPGEEHLDQWRRHFYLSGQVIDLNLVAALATDCNKCAFEIVARYPPSSPNAGEATCLVRRWTGKGSATRRLETGEVESLSGPRGCERRDSCPQTKRKCIRRSQENKTKWRRKKKKVSFLAFYSHFFSSVDYFFCAWRELSGVRTGRRASSFADSIQDNAFYLVGLSFFHTPELLEQSASLPYYLAVWAN